MESSKIYAYLFLCMLCISSVTPILGCGYCGKPPKKHKPGKKPKTPSPITLPPIIGKPPVTVPPITLPPVVKPPVTVPPVTGREGIVHVHLQNLLHAPLIP
ncbi:hypothetical protein VNO77_24246 [Canavalia gladiata]|uniref:Uncharacterized protein n=1 Tax=Canavalia gladiata TaxID=3824 RepID=A0AAN9L6N5_CANGL